jgi:signal transduction histidine kinase
MLYELHALTEFLRVHTNHVHVPDEVHRILAALDAAITINHGDADERLARAVAAGDAEAAAAASRELATPLNVDTGIAERAANDAIRQVLLDSDLYQQLRDAYDSAAISLTEAVKLAPPGSPAPVLASAKVREAYASMPQLLDNAVKTGNAVAEYIKQIVGQNPDNVQTWDGTRLSVFVRDEQHLRRELHRIWTLPPSARMSLEQKLVAITQAGGTLKAPEQPVYVTWDIPPLGPNGEDQLAMTPAEWAKATEKYRPTLGWGMGREYRAAMSTAIGDALTDE